METLAGSSIHVGVGYATQPDAFQSGREAAQMAKGQLPEGVLDLVLVFGPPGSRFKDFIEGVRLVTGEEALVGVPADLVFTTEGAPSGEGVVFAVQATGTHLSIASADLDPTNTLPGLSSLWTQWRQARGNARRGSLHHGVIVFDNGANAPLADPLSEVGLESWLAGLSVRRSTTSPLVCGGRTISTGLVGIECLSSAPWGVGTVDVSAFRGQRDVYRDAIKSALRDARLQLNKKTPAAGLLFFPMQEKDADDHDAFLACAESVVPNVPLIALQGRYHYARPFGRGVLTRPESLVALLVPQ